MKKLIQITIILFWAASALAQPQGAWVEKQLPDVLPTDKLFTAGENCVIYVGKNDSVIYTYDLISGQWHEYHQPTTLPWKYIAAGKDVAIVATDSILTAYSAISQGYSSLNYEGTLLGLGGSSSLYHIGCSESLAYFITDKCFYVFDSKNSQWYTHPINDLEEIDEDIKYTKPGYILVKISDNSDNEKLIVFTTVSNKFFELNWPYVIAFEALDYGFVAWRSNFSTFENQFFGCYSAIHNTWTEHNENGEYYTVGVSSIAQNLSPRTVYMFRVSTLLEYPDYNHTFYIYNTLYPEPCVVSRSSNDDYQIHSFSVGAQTAVISFMNRNNNSIEVHSYQSDTHTINPCIVSDLHVEQDVNWHSCGGKIYIGNDLHQTIGAYPNEQVTAYAPMPADYENNFKWTRIIEPRDDWGIMLIEDKDADSAYVYSYNIASSDTLTHFNTEWGNYSGNYSGIKISDDKDVAGLLAVNPTGYTMFLYSPVLDVWTQKASGPDSPVGIYLGGDFLYYREPNSNQLSVFNGANNQYLELPYGYTGFSNVADNTYSGENYVIVYTAENKYMAYSAITGTSSEIATDRHSVYTGERNICTAKRLNNKSVMTYNALSGAFIIFEPTETQGIVSFKNTGGNTALLLTSNGYLFAFDPNKDMNTFEENIASETDLPSGFQLDQNYPNPFQTVTSIKFFLSAPQLVRIEIYNAQGCMIRTLVNKEIAAGHHVIDFDSEGLSGGIYFYRLTAGSFQQNKKMLLLK